ncbi:MAG: DUF2510 domain-containing protein [Ilumatobacteraceae bacterium]
MSRIRTSASLLAVVGFVTAGIGGALGAISHTSGEGTTVTERFGELLPSLETTLWVVLVAGVVCTLLAQFPFQRWAAFGSLAAAGVTGLLAYRLWDRATLAPDRPGSLGLEPGTVEPALGLWLLSIGAGVAAVGACAVLLSRRRARRARLRQEPPMLLPAEPVEVHPVADRRQLRKMGLPSASSAWLPDPWNRSDERWWDGTAWTHRVRGAAQVTRRERRAARRAERAATERELAERTAAAEAAMNVADEPVLAPAAELDEFGFSTRPATDDSWLFDPPAGTPVVVDDPLAVDAEQVSEANAPR